MSENVLVVGARRSGLGAAELLIRQGANVRVMDANPLPPEEQAKFDALGVAVVQQSPENLGTPDRIVLSPGVPYDAPMFLEARERGIPVIGEVELASYFLKGPIAGITGSNGKTTTTALAGHLLKECGLPAQVGGNIGTPVTSLVAGSHPDQWNVLELSSFQLESIAQFRANIAVCLNVTPDHLDRHHTFEAYAQAKRRLFETQQPGDFAVLNWDDPVCRAFAQHTAAEIFWFSTRYLSEPQNARNPGLASSSQAPLRTKNSANAGGAGNLLPVPAVSTFQGMWLHSDEILWNGTPFLRRDNIKLRGIHNVENAMAAALIAHLAGAPLDGIASAVAAFPGVEHRIEFVRELHGVAYFNDSKATNVDATLKAVAAFESGLWIVLGGKDKGAGYEPLVEPLSRKAKAALLIGLEPPYPYAAAPLIRRTFKDKAPCVDCGTLDAAVEYAHAHAQPGDTVLLSPACASFDQFKGYEQRGNAFKHLVQKLF